MNAKVAILSYLVHTAIAQDINCDFRQSVLVNRTYPLFSPNYPYNYRAGSQCRWIADCPAGYNCELDCPEITIPMTQSCTLDRLLVSRTGDPTLVAAERYCGNGSLNAVSTGQRLVLGLVSSRGSPGGRFRCQLSAKRIEPEPAQCQCGEKGKNRIVGGEVTKVNEYKMMAALYDRSIAQIKCGAVIISPEHVLTAAHCLMGQQISNYVVIVGAHDYTAGDSSAMSAYNIDAVATHPFFRELNYDYDIAIVRVKDSIGYNDGVGPVCLPFKFLYNDLAGINVTILGWGTLFPGGPVSNVLRKVEVGVISQDTCRTQVPNVTARQVCTYAPGKDACQDDSGGPLLYMDPATKLLFNMGIVSFGRSCASEYPGVNTRVPSLLNWIVRTTRINYCVK